MSGEDRQSIFRKSYSAMGCQDFLVIDNKRMISSIDWIAASGNFHAMLLSADDVHIQLTT
jgi:hypothetical protein